jgi:hypothetical protein
MSDLQHPSHQGLDPQDLSSAAAYRLLVTCVAPRRSRLSPLDRQMVLQI